MRLSALALCVLSACAGAQRRSSAEFCRTLQGEQRALAEKARECETPLSPPSPEQCSQAAEACTGADQKLLASEAACVEHLPRCIDPQSCQGDSCGDATPGADLAWRDQRESCRRLAVDVSAPCKAALAGVR